ncbi:hypothetical protein ACWKWC_10100, partial [Geodermatophilus nigrescens]
AAAGGRPRRAGGPPGPAPPPTAAVLAVLALLWSATDGWTGLLVTLLPLLAALTLPHALVVAWQDRAEGAGGQMPGTAPAARARPTGRSTP